LLHNCLVNNLKTVSSRYLKKDFSDRFAQFYWKDALWSSSYFISSCGGVTVDVLKKYVQEQNRPA
jgi:putative transposase